MVSFPTTDAVASETSGGSFSGARPGFPTSISATVPRFRSRRVPSRLTSRSSRPRVVASAMCFTLRLHTSAAPPQGGLTQALGGRKAFCSFAFRHRDFAGFGQHCSSETLLLRFFFGQVRMARSTITCCALAGSGYCHSPSFCSPAPHAVASETAGKVRGARSCLPASAFGRSAKASPSPGSSAPNKSFKPTPCRGVGHVLYATLAHVRRPATGRLNSGVRPVKCRMP